MIISIKIREMGRFQIVAILMMRAKVSKKRIVEDV